MASVTVSKGGVSSVSLRKMGVASVTVSNGSVASVYHCISLSIIISKRGVAFVFSVPVEVRGCFACQSS